MARKTDIGRIRPALEERIRGLRDKAGLAQEDAAHRAGIDYKRWQRIEAGDVNSTVRTLARVADALGITFWQLVREPGGANNGALSRQARCRPGEGDAHASTGVRGSRPQTPRKDVHNNSVLFQQRRLRAPLRCGDRVRPAFRGWLTMLARRGPALFHDSGHGFGTRAVGLPVKRREKFPAVVGEKRVASKRRVFL